MKFFLQCLFFFVVIASLVIGWAYYKRKSSPENNRRVALSWFSEMDVVSEGQRYRGSRSEILLDFDSRPINGIGYKLIVGCRTQSGRLYYLSVVSTMCLVTDWWIIPADPDTFNASTLDNSTS